MEVVRERVPGPCVDKVCEANSAMVFYAWDKPESLVLAEGHELSVQEQRAVLRSHVNLGHPGRAEFVRLLKAAGCRNDIILYAQRPRTTTSYAIAGGYPEMLRLQRGHRDRRARSGQQDRASCAKRDVPWNLVLRVRPDRSAASVCKPHPQSFRAAVGQDVWTTRFPAVRYERRIHRQ